MQEGNEPPEVEYTPETIKEKMIYNGYQILTDKMYMKPVDSTISYHFDLTNGTFRISNEEDTNTLRSFNWETYENYGDTKVIFDSEMEALGLSVDDIRDVPQLQ